MNDLTGARQRGAALIVSLILLVGITTIVLTSFNLTVNDLKIAGNMQYRAEAAASAHQAIENAISSTRFFEEPGAVYIQEEYISGTCTAENTYCTDVTGDGDADITVTLTPDPSCVVARTIKNAELNLSESEDLGCSIGVQQTFGVEGAVTGDSLCAQTTWEIRAEAKDPVTETLVAMREGVAVRVAVAEMATQCP